MLDLKKLKLYDVLVSAADRSIVCVVLEIKSRVGQYNEHVLERKCKVFYVFQNKVFI